MENALYDSEHFFETLGIGGMTTRGFGRLKIDFDYKNKKNESEDENPYCAGSQDKGGRNDEK